MARWAAEHPVDLALAVRLIGDQFPELDPAGLERLGSGWDNQVYRLGELVFRFPHRALAVELIEVERDALGHVAAMCGVSVPEPVKIGEPSECFPYPFLGQRFVPGRAPEEGLVTEVDREALAETLAEFLGQLHGCDRGRAAEWGVPPDAFRGEMQRMTELAGQIVAGVKGLVADPQVQRVLAALADVPDDAFEEEAVLCHGDLHVRHVLFDDEGQVSGVIDWGDLCLGDRAIDLSAVYAMLEARHRAGFWRHYGAVTEGVAARARHLALAKHLAQLASAVEQGLNGVETVARQALHRAL